ncbi:MAG: SIMPL domain-containing protein [Bacillota bacterium]
MDINPPHMHLSAHRGVKYGIVAVLALLALFLFAKSWQTFDQIGRIQGTVPTITVSGTGKASAAPTIATISFTVEENASTVAAAQDAATKRTNDALAAIKKLGVEDKDVQASGYSVTPQYESRPCPAGSYCPQDTSKITGYKVYQSITVKVRDTAKAGDVLAALGQAGVQNVSGPNFAVDDDTAVQAEARGKAIDDARAKAETLAKQLHVHLGKVINFSESGGTMPYYAYGKGGAADSLVAPQAAPTLPPGQNETSVTVSVTYEIR